MEKIDLDDDDAFETITTTDGRRVEVLKNRHRMRVPMMMADAVRPNVQLHDGRGGPVGHRPGFVHSSDSVGADAKQRAYDLYDAEISTSYKNPPTGFGSHEFVGQREGDVCTINGAPGRLRRGSDGRLVCVPDQRQGASTTLDARTAAYREYEEYITTAFRG